MAAASCVRRACDPCHNLKEKCRRPDADTPYDETRSKDGPEATLSTKITLHTTKFDKFSIW
ncbi:hypothetical protein N7509_003397 [Penicillium cosmopolitanum]|uniref:Uncharacterized protein n=1 Tax=Penicillium cosmopolitanum TaxID=1131564 RepID=A0A9X0BBB2_9EURO|nr:uncharacterized protein N7509_003397 [Penicillium cosmopolitanum]KAJ5403526.1 hypothetical protein N7509_003397 [Penicillium cosmopolitanum]